jgi:hypothetical protein
MILRVLRRGGEARDLRFDPDEFHVLTREKRKVAGDNRQSCMPPTWTD